MSALAKATNAPPPMQRFGIPRVAMTIAIVVTILQHVTMLYTIHLDGDEGVYTALAKEMNWDLSHYTTKDDEEISKFPYTCYRHDLFFHPPLYPLVLKTGLAMETWSVKSGFRKVLVQRFGITPNRIGVRNSPEVALVAFAFAILIRISALLVLGRLLNRWQTPEFASIVVLIALVVCPVTTFSTVRWHHDGLLGLLALMAFALLCESLKTGSISVFTMGLAAALAALNIRYNAIVLAPCFLAIPFFDVVRRLRSPTADQTKASLVQTVRTLPAWWWAFFAVASIALLTIGLSHFLRVYLHFGTLSPGVINKPDIEFLEGLPEDQRKTLLDFMAGQKERTLALFGIETLLLMPILLLLAHPHFWTGFARDIWQGRERGFIVLVGLYGFGVVTLVLTSQVRYLAAAMPMVYLFLAVALDSLPVRAWQQALISFVLATHAFLATGSSFIGAHFNDPAKQGNVLPSAYLYAPRMHPWMEKTFGNVAEVKPPEESAAGK